MKYKKMPVVIHAFRFGYDEKPAWCFLNERANDDGYGSHFLIETLEGVMRANIGDYIIKGIQGEIYPCRADIFEATYEAVDE